MNAGSRGFVHVQPYAPSAAPETRVWFGLETRSWWARVVNAYLSRNPVGEAVEELLRAERVAPEQVHEHLMSRQLVLRLRATATGKPDRRLAELARRMKIL